jgi:hypothetical protein
METIDQKIAKLPKWAQQEIRALRMNVQRLESALEEPEDTNTYAGNRPDGYGYSVRLGKNERVYYQVGDKQYIEVHLNRDGKSISIYGEEPLTVLPLVSNVIDVQLRAR